MIPEITTIMNSSNNKSPPDSGLNALASLKLGISPLHILGQSQYPWACPKSTPKFQEFKQIGGFEISKDGKYKKDPNIRQTINLENIQRFVGVNLGEGWTTAELIKDYKSYRQLKQEFFLKWLVENKFFEKIQNSKYKKPDFICFGGFIKDTMVTPWRTKYGEWEIYAAKYLDTIFIWNQEINNDSGGGSLTSYYAFYFECLLTGRDPRKEVLNEFQKNFIIQEISFGNHQLLVVKEVDAQDSCGKIIDLKIHPTSSIMAKRAKFLRLWSQCIVGGVEKICLGRRDDCGFLKEISVLKLDKILSTSGHTPLGANMCFDFQDRLFTWINSQFQENNATIVRKLEWGGLPSAFVQSSLVHNSGDEYMIPKWFVEATSQK